MNPADAVRDALTDALRPWTDPTDPALPAITERLVVALVAAGWGDLTAEQERLAQKVDDNAHRWRGSSDVRHGMFMARDLILGALSIRETPEETP